MQKQISDQIIIALDAYRDTRDRIEEGLFFAIYGSPVVQGMLGLNSSEKIRELPGVSPEMRAAKKAAGRRICSEGPHRWVRRGIGSCSALCDIGRPCAR